MKMAKRGFGLLLTIAILLPLISGAIADDVPVEFNLDPPKLEEILKDDEDSEDTPPSLEPGNNPPPDPADNMPPASSLEPAPIELILPEALIVGEPAFLSASVPDNATGTLQLYVGDQLFPAPELLFAAGEEETETEPLPTNLLTVFFTPDSEGPFTIMALYTPGADDVYGENTAGAELYAVAAAPTEDDQLEQVEELADENPSGMLFAPMAFAAPKVTPDMDIQVIYKGPINGTIAYDVIVTVTVGGIPQPNVPVRFSVNGLFISLDPTGDGTIFTNELGVALFPYQTKNEYTTYSFRAETKGTNELNAKKSDIIIVEGIRTEIRAMQLVKDPAKREITAYIKTVDDLPIGADEYVDFTFMNANFSDISPALPGYTVSIPIQAAGGSAPAGYAYEAVCNYESLTDTYGVHANVRESALLTPYYAAWRAAKAYIEFSIVEVGALQTSGGGMGRYSCNYMIHVVGDNMDNTPGRGVWGTISQVIGGSVQPYYGEIGTVTMTPPIPLPLAWGSIPPTTHSFWPGEHEYTIHFVDTTGNNTPTVATGRFNVEPQNTAGSTTPASTATLTLSKPNASLAGGSASQYTPVAGTTDTFTATVSNLTYDYATAPAAPTADIIPDYTAIGAPTMSSSGHVFIRFTWEDSGITQSRDVTLWSTGGSPSTYTAKLTDGSSPTPIPIGNTKSVSAQLMGEIKYTYSYQYQHNIVPPGSDIYRSKSLTRVYTSAAAVWYLDFPSFRVIEAQDVDDMSFEFIAYGDRTPVKPMWFWIPGAHASVDPFTPSLANGVSIPLTDGKGVYPPSGSYPEKWWISLKPGLHSVTLGYPKDIHDNYRADTVTTNVYVHEVPTRLTLDKKHFGSDVLVATVRIDDGINTADGGGEGKVPRFGVIRFTKPDGTYDDVPFVKDDYNTGLPENRGIAEWKIPKGVFYVTAQYIPDPTYGPYIKSNKCFWLKQLQLDFNCDLTETKFVYSLWTRIINYQEIIDTRIIPTLPPEGYCVYYLNGTFNLDLPIPFVREGYDLYGELTFITETNKLYSAPIGTNFVVARYVGDDYPPSESAIAYIEGPYPTLWHTGEPLPGEQTESTERSGTRSTSNGLILRARPAVPTASVPLFEMPYREHITVRDESGELRFYYPLYDEKHELPEQLSEKYDLLLVTDQAYDLYHYTLSLSALTALNEAYPDGAFEVYTPQFEARIPFETVILFKELDAYLRNAGHSRETVTVTYQFEATPEDNEHPYCVTMVLTDAYGAELSLDPEQLPEDTVKHAANPFDVSVLSQSPLALEMIPFEE